MMGKHVSISVLCGIVLFVLAGRSVKANYTTEYMPADVALGINLRTNDAANLTDPCYLSTYSDYPTDNMLVWFDFTGWPTNTDVQSATLRLTRSSIETTGNYDITAWALQAGNTTWYKYPSFVTGNYQYDDGEGGNPEVPWNDGDGGAVTVEEAGDLYFGNIYDYSWNGDVIDLTLGPSKVENWLSGAYENNGLRVYGTTTWSDKFYVSGPNKPVLIIESDAPEPASFALLALGGVGLLLSKRR